ncbi:hypothetical protein ES705_25332 [subsurface metagenome]
MFGIETQILWLHFNTKTIGIPMCMCLITSVVLHLLQFAVNSSICTVFLSPSVF